ncbi:MAG TPA: acetolactate synthase large subunit [Usitatibacter sp.]|nr:acetolactate synthase large subunit [Usitatibacter sp.]
MNGAESLARTLLACGIDTCFANPGTSEMHFVAALDQVEGLRCVLGLAETVVTGCADGYARMAGKPAATLLHCGPGFANGIANLHNARRAGSPIVNVVGDHATYHAQFDPPLAADTEALTRAVSHWMKTGTAASSVGADAAAAVQAANAPPGRIATLVLPADCAWNEGGEVAQPLPALQPAGVASETHDALAELLRGGEACMLVLAGSALGERGLAAAHRISAATGAALRTPTQVSRMARGRGRPPVDRIPYSVDAAVQALARVRHVILVGAARPVAFFAYPGKPSLVAPPDASYHVLATAEQDGVAALEALAQALGAPRAPALAQLARPVRARGKFTPEAFGATLASVLPEDAIVVEEAVTSGRQLFPPTFAAAPHDWLQITGGAIGYGFPCATGAAVAAPNRKVVCLQADGGGMYSLQALWTQAREKLDVVNVVFANRMYRILQGELAAVGAKPGRASADLFDLSRPTLDWVKLAAGMGVEGAAVDTMEAFADVFDAACSRRGPFLIELVI